jgi:long-chain acyl-CoA synthetase
MASYVLNDFLRFDRYPKRVAVIEQSAFRRCKYTYEEIQRGVNSIIHSLEQHGIQEGDKVLLWGENSARWMMTFYACLKRNIVVVPMDASFSADFVEKVRRMTKAKLVCSDAEGKAWNDLLKPGPQTDLPPYAAPASDQLLEIIYTSGTTGEPKGVMITHGNLLANLVPIYEEYQKYKKYAKPFSPLRFVHLIPLSHLFGQVMALFIPQMLNGTLIYPAISAPQIIEATKENRASVITCVPQELSVLRKYVTKKHSPQMEKSKGKKSALITILSRWWEYRSIHREFGWKFWAFIVGGATLPVEEEEFWKDLGFAVIQGYGMTETAPSITITHPFKGMKSGFVGKTLPGLEIKLAEDGEILVRGPHVSPGYFENVSATGEMIKEGWLHTGDLGKFDEEGNLQLLGRKKEVIVTSEGLNVYPDDVEAVLNRHPLVADSAVVAKEAGSRSVVHAVLVLKDDTKADQADGIIQDANRQLESFQRVQSYNIWPLAELPRTSTGKLKRLAIAQGAAAASVASENTPEQLARQLLSGAHGADSDQELGLSSLDRVELMMELESAGAADIDEAAFAQAKTFREMANLMRDRENGEDTGPVPKSYPYWNWTRWLPVRLFRYLSWYGLVFPFMPLRMKIHASGLEHLPESNSPVFFVSNHQSILDAPAILKALPNFRWRCALAPAMGARRAKLDLYAAGLFFNTYPLPPTSVGLRKAIELTGELVDQGYSPLVFPEGERTLDGLLKPFRPGVGVLVHHTKIPVIPVVLRGAYEIWPIHARGPRKKGIIEVHFDHSIDFSGKSPAEITTTLEQFFKQRLMQPARP